MISRPAAVRLVGGPFAGQTVTVSEACRVFTVPISYRRVAEDEFVYCRPPTYMGQAAEGLEWDQLTIEEESHDQR